MKIRAAVKDIHGIDDCRLMIDDWKETGCALRPNDRAFLDFCFRPVLLA